MQTLIHHHEDPQQSNLVTQPPPPSTHFPKNLLPIQEPLYIASPCNNSIRLPSLDNCSSIQYRQPTSLAPLRFIIPSSHTSTPNQSRPSTPLLSPHPPLDSHSSESSQPPLEPESLKSSSSSLNDKQRTRKVKNPHRSTKSKARPGLRKGKWTEEEEQYAWQLTTYFKQGLLHIARGTMLRLYLSQKLNCEPMRITKKFTGEECIGKQVFRPATPTPEIQLRMIQAEKQLQVLEHAFLQQIKENTKERGSEFKSLKEEEMSSDDSSNTSVEERMDTNAVGLLLDFFYKASRKEEGKEPEKEDEEEEDPVVEKEVTTSPMKRLRTLSITHSPCITTMTKRSRIGSLSLE